MDKHTLLRVIKNKPKTPGDQSEKIKGYDEDWDGANTIGGAGAKSKSKKDKKKKGKSIVK